MVVSARASRLLRRMNGSNRFVVSPVGAAQRAARCGRGDTDAMTKTRLACAVLGVISLLAAALLAWLITPKWVARVPSGKSLDRTYESYQTYQTYHVYQAYERTFRALLDCGNIPHEYSDPAFSSGSLPYCRQSPDNRFRTAVP